MKRDLNEEKLERIEYFVNGLNAKAPYLNTFCSYFATTNNIILEKN